MDYVLNEHLDFMPTWHICNIISNNIVIQLLWKFQESNWNPDWFIALMDSIDTNYIFTNNKKSWPIWPKCNTIPDNAMLQLSWKFGLSKWYPYWVNMLASSSGTKYVLNEHEDVGQYGPYVILSEVIPCYRYPASLLDQFEILIDSSC